MATVEINAVQGYQNMVIDVVAGETFRRAFTILDKNNNPVSLFGAQSIQWVIGDLTIDMNSGISIGGTTYEKIQVESTFTIIIPTGVKKIMIDTYMKVVLSGGYVFYPFSKSRVKYYKP